MLDREVVERKLRETVQLHALALRLPHLATARETQLLEALEAFLQRGGACSEEAALAGVSSLWRKRKFGHVVAAATMLPLLNRDLQSWAGNALLILRGPRGLDLNQVLNYWDPIGVANEVDDEYSGYAQQLGALLDQGATADDLARALSSIATARMGLPTSPVKEMITARALVAVYSGRYQH